MNADDIFTRLRAEERDRNEAIRLWRANTCSGGIREDDHIRTLVRDAADEIALMRYLLSEQDKPDTQPARSAK
jgi:hypothetical protein